MAQKHLVPFEVAKFEDAYKFDRLIAQLQTELIRGGGKFTDLRDTVFNLVSSLRINLSQVKGKLPVFEGVKSDEFWDEVTVGDLEEIRDQRGALSNSAARTKSPNSIRSSLTSKKMKRI